MNFQSRLTFAFIAFLAVFVYINLFSKPAPQKKEPTLFSATTNEVVATLGKPFRTTDSTNFIESTDEMAEEGYPVSTADMRAKGTVWLYRDGGVSAKGLQRYQTIFFNENNRVYAIYTTYWMNDLWGSNN